MNFEVLSTVLLYSRSAVNYISRIYTASSAERVFSKGFLYISCIFSMSEDHKIVIEIITTTNPKVFTFWGEQHTIYYILLMADINLKG